MSAVSSVVLLSGGLDSAANLALCVERDQAVLALTFDYGQRAARRELNAAQAISRYYDVPHRSIDVRWLGELGGSALTEKQLRLPEIEAARLDDAAVTRESARAVWVPNRNGVFLNVGASFAERLGAARVVVGFNREEAATFPDNSSDYLARTTGAFELSTANHVAAHSYTAEMDKREIVRALRGLRRAFPFELLWSCYSGGIGPEEAPCGRCESCQRLARALDG